MSALTADEARRAAEQVDGEWPELAALLRRYADALGLPETLESLRAERDEARAEVDEIKASVGYWRQSWRDVCAALDHANVEPARLRATHMEDEATVVWARGLKLSWSHSGPATEVLAPKPAPGGEHWLGGDHSNQTPRAGAE